MALRFTAPATGPAGNAAPAAAVALLKGPNLVGDCEAGMGLRPAPGLRCLPMPLRHDGGVTFGFRFEGAADLFGEGSAIAYAADLGSWDASLAASLADVD